MCIHSMIHSKYTTYRPHISNICLLYIYTYVYINTHTYINNMVEMVYACIYLRLIRGNRLTVFEYSWTPNPRNAPVVNQPIVLQNIRSIYCKYIYIYVYINMLYNAFSFLCKQQACREPCPKHSHAPTQRLFIITIIIISIIIHY